MSDNPVTQEVTNFDKDKLRKTETTVKVILPTKEVIEEEKKANSEGK